MVPRGGLPKKGGALEVGTPHNGRPSLEIREGWCGVCTFLCRIIVLTFESHKLDGSAAPSVSAVLLEELPEGEARAEKEQIAKNCAGVAFVGRPPRSLNCQIYLLICSVHRRSRYGRLYFLLSALHSA